MRNALGTILMTLALVHSPSVAAPVDGCLPEPVGPERVAANWIEVYEHIEGRPFDGTDEAGAAKALTHLDPNGFIFGITTPQSRFFVQRSRGGLLVTRLPGPVPPTTRGLQLLAPGEELSELALTRDVAGCTEDGPCPQVTEVFLIDQAGRLRFADQCTHALNDDTLPPEFSIVGSMARYRHCHREARSRWLDFSGGRCRTFDPLKARARIDHAIARMSRNRSATVSRFLRPLMKIDPSGAAHWLRVRYRKRISRSWYRFGAVEDCAAAAQYIESLPSAARDAARAVCAEARRKASEHVD